LHGHPEPPYFAKPGQPAAPPLVPERPLRRTSAVHRAPQSSAKRALRQERAAEDRAYKAAERDRQRTHKKQQRGHQRQKKQPRPPRPAGRPSHPAMSSAPSSSAAASHSIAPAAATAVIAGAGDGGVKSATTLMDRALMCPAAMVMAPYLLVDSPAVAPIRARLRLCETSLDEHLVLRHRSSTGVVSPTGCRACGAAPETVDHVYLHCPVFNVPRSAASDALGVLGARLDRAAIAAVSPVGLVGDDLCARVALATADLLLAVRASPRLRPAR
jgi:hypothetical protein